jgi:FkbM family methyltransferase
MCSRDISFLQFINKLSSELRIHPSYEYYAWDIAHTPNGQYIVDNHIYTGVVVRASSIFHTCFEPTACAVMAFLARSAGTFVDIGANVGYYSLWLSSLVKNIYAFEPSSPLMELLRLNAKLTNSANILTFKYALGDFTGDSLQAENIPVWTHARDAISSMTFDDFATVNNLGQPSYLIKMDVDGYEGKIIRGMRDFLKRNNAKTNLILEITPQNILRFGSSPEEISDLFDALGYTVYQIIDDTATPLPDANSIAVSINGKRVGKLRRIDLKSELSQKEINCIVTHQKLTDIDIELPFLRQKQEVIELIDQNAAPAEILKKIQELGNPIFTDQWARFVAIAHKQRTEEKDGNFELPRLPCYQTRKGWTYIFQDEPNKARQAFLQAAEHPSLFFKIKAAVGLYRIGCNDDCGKILENCANEAIRLFSQSDAPSLAKIGEADYLLDAVEFLHLLKITPAADELTVALAKNFNTLGSLSRLGKIAIFYDRRKLALTTLLKAYTCMEPHYKDSSMARDVIVNLLTLRVEKNKDETKLYAEIEDFFASIFYRFEWTYRSLGLLVKRASFPWKIRAIIGYIVATDFIFFFRTVRRKIKTFLEPKQRIINETASISFQARDFDPLTIHRKNKRYHFFSQRRHE